MCEVYVYKYGKKLNLVHFGMEGPKKSPDLFLAKK